MDLILEFVVNIFNGIFNLFNVPFLNFSSYSLLILSIILFFLILRIFIEGGRK